MVNNQIMRVPAVVAGTYVTEKSKLRISIKPCGYDVQIKTGGFASDDVGEVATPDDLDELALFLRELAAHLRKTEAFSCAS